MLFHLHHRIYARVSRVRLRTRYPLAEPHESAHWNRRSWLDDHGYVLRLSASRIWSDVLATIINSDLIPFHNRGMYQAAQNVLNGFGAICGASFGGTIADTIGWRWCFLLQVPVSIFALIVGHFVIQLPRTPTQRNSNAGLRGVWQQVDLSGALLLVLGVSAQLAGLSLGGNELPWSNPWVITSLAGSVVLVALFFVVEAKTSAVPIIPLRMLRGVLPVSTQIANVCVGMAAYAVSDVDVPI